MEYVLLLTPAVIAAMICVPLIVQMARRGFAWYARLYVALMAVSVMLVCQTSASGVRPFGYLPEILLVGLVAIGFLVGLILSLNLPSSRSERVGMFKSPF